jgi:hypothetical protein
MTSGVMAAELTRSKAKEIIEKVNNYPWTITGTIYTDAMDSMKATLGEMGKQRSLRHSYRMEDAVAAGLMNKTGNSVTLTNQNKQYLMNASKESATYKLGTIKFGEITGIRTISPTAKQVDFTEITETTPAGDALKYKNKGIQAQQVQFVLYDDGWRMVR